MPMLEQHYSTAKFKAYLDGELSRLEAALMERHLTRCTTCAAESESLRRHDAMIRSADLFHSPELEAPRFGIGADTALRFRGIQRRFAYAAASVLAILGMLVAATLPHGGRTPSASVAAAVSQANTWHLHGWRQIGGKRVAWDIWGRRAPYFLYERTGDLISYDDGKRRVRLYPPDPSLNRPNGLAIISPTEYAPNTIGGLEPSASGMVGQWDWEQGGGLFAQKPFQQTLTRALFREQAGEYVQQGVNANRIYTVSKFTWLPIEYRLHSDTVSKRQWDTEYLSANYDASLPAAVLHPIVPAGYANVDLTDPKQGVIQLSATPYALDKQGNCILRYTASLGGNPLRQPSQFAVGISTWNDEESLRAVTSAGASRRYIHTTNAFSNPPDPSGAQYDLLSPLEPISDVHDLPRQAAVEVQITPTITVPDTDEQREDGQFEPLTKSDTLLSETRAIMVAMPIHPTVARIDDALPPTLNLLRGQPLALQAMQQRVSYYYQASYFAAGKRFTIPVIQAWMNKHRNLRVFRNGVQISNDYDVFYEWHKQQYAALKERAIAPAAATMAQYTAMHRAYLLTSPIARHAPKGSALARTGWIDDLRYLAYLYHQAGQPKNERQTMQQYIALDKEYFGPSTLEQRQAQYALRTGSYWYDSGYKGPS